MVTAVFNGAEIKIMHNCCTPSTPPKFWTWPAGQAWSWMLKPVFFSRFESRASDLVASLPLGPTKNSKLKSGHVLLFNPP